MVDVFKLGQNPISEAECLHESLLSQISDKNFEFFWRMNNNSKTKMNFNRTIIFFSKSNLKIYINIKYTLKKQLTSQSKICDRDVIITPLL